MTDETVKKKFGETSVEDLASALMKIELIFELYGKGG